MKTQVWLCAAGLLALALAGCGGSSSSTNTSGPILLVPHSVTTTLPNGLTGTLMEDRSAVSVGGTVTYTMTLANPTSVQEPLLLLKRHLLSAIPLGRLFILWDRWPKLSELGSP